MFTGIVEEMGKIRKITRGSRSSSLTISATRIMEDLKIGDSIATNGVCLTVNSYDTYSFSADIMSESLSRSNLGQLSVGSKVNLERALQVNERLGGHIVTGHVDGTGKISNISKDDNATWFTIEADKNVMRYIVEKGSITIDGISLTIAKMSKINFSVSIIPHTLSNTVLKDKRVGDRVNLENDILGKYVEKMLFNQALEVRNNEHTLTLAKLIESGF